MSSKQGLGWEVCLNNGKKNGNYYLVYRGYIRMMEKKMEATLCKETLTGCLRVAVSLDDLLGFRV